MQLLYIQLCSFDGNCYVYLCAFIPIRIIFIYYSHDAFLLLKIVRIGFLFGVNLCVFITMMLFIVKIF